MQISEFGGMNWVLGRTSSSATVLAENSNDKNDVACGLKPESGARHVMPFRNERDTTLSVDAIWHKEIRDKALRYKKALHAYASDIKEKNLSLSGSKYWLNLRCKFVIRR